MPLSKIVRPLAAGLGALALASSAFATDYTVATPTADPFYKTEVTVGAGAFLDTYSFDVASSTDAYVWVFPYIPNDFTALFTGTYFLQLKVYNSQNVQIGTGLTASQLGIDLYSDPSTAAYAAQLKAAGYDPANSLFVGGTLAAGSYTVTISGIGNVAGGAYIAKFNIPSVVPEPGTQALLFSGLLIVGLAVRHRAAKSAQA
ncbi:MAG TPA: hypothetical protein H9903_03620 [Candidatus Aquabacterium excrementipullorum]|nr:hypothetical protein [Candidatus Aquabacterium excrementipullorum]